MPNTLAHLGIQTLITRVLIRRAELEWIFAGAVIPDVPWILGRAIRTLLPGQATYDLWAYLIAQSSLVVSLLLCGAVAAMAASSQRAFAILSLNALLHLLLDALQTKVGNGVHLVAPVSWKYWRADWFPIESWPTYALTALGLVVAIRGIGTIWRTPSTNISPAPSRRQLATAALLLAAYLIVPAVLRFGPIAADSNSVGTLRDRGSRTGRAVTFDRAPYRVRDNGHYIRTYTGEELAVVPARLTASATVSAHATFADDSTLVVREIQVHRWPRDLMSYAGLLLIGIAWIISLSRSGSGRGVSSPRAGGMPDAARRGDAR
jgi:hypothetical protein